MHGLTWARRGGYRTTLGLLVMLLAAAAGAAQTDAECLVCHGDRSMAVAASGRSVYVNPERHQQSVHGPLGCTTCHTTIREFPHPKRIPRVQCATCHGDAPAAIAKSAHAPFGAAACASCHGAPHEISRSAQAFPQNCAACHADVVRNYRESVHGAHQAAGDPDSPACASCHGPAHTVIAAREPDSPVAKRNLPATCGACHANPDFLARHLIPFARPIETFRLSVHGRAVEAGVAGAPSCSDCHASHSIFPARDERSMINHWRVPATCGACHAEIAAVYNESVHGTAVARGVRGAPVCTDCHGEHQILAPSEPGSLVNPARVSSVTCGRCHGDERLAQRYNLPVDKVPAFEDSYHGLALRAGSQTVANCASCHGVHNILPSSDPRSTVHPANLAATCGACHPGAGERFAIGAVHVRPGTESEHVVVMWIRLAYYVLIPLAIAFMFLHNLLDWLAKLIRGSAIHHSGETVERMGLHFRIAHWMTMASFLVLVYTGFALRYSDQWWAAPLLRWEAEVAFRGWVHRFAGVVLIIAFGYHVIHLIVSRSARRILAHLAPSSRDALDAWNMLRYNLGWTKDRPVFAKFGYPEKIEYWAFVWGTAVMAASGVMLWANNFMLRNFPKWVLDAAGAIHFYEAILAAFSILIWHFYFVIFDPDVYPMDKAWLTGRTSADHLRHTRPAYYLELVRQQRQAERAARADEADEAEEAGEAKEEGEKPVRGAGPEDTSKE